MNGMQKVNFDLLFPVIIVYVAAPLLFLCDRIPSPYTIGWSQVLFVCMMFLSVWWVMIYYDGKISTALTWIVRYLVMIVPIWIVFYLGMLQKPDSYMLLIDLIIMAFSNTASGLLSFGIRKVVKSGMPVFILLVSVCIVMVAV
jgi:hypothetical protein